ncbi:MAG: hypothetical protein K8J08_17405, partial [Thermoanaerobaculia bacterium]|nr:hypothetical protein [Thermoanaerobaculia bacterium]
MFKSRCPKGTALAALLFVFGVLPVSAGVLPEREGVLAGKEYRDASLQIFDLYEPAAAVIASNPSLTVGPSGEDFAEALYELGVAPEHAFVDQRSGRWSTLFLSQPVVPGIGVGNDLSWGSQAEPSDRSELKQRSWDALVSYLDENRTALGIDSAELAQGGSVSVHQDGHMISVYGARVIDGIPVRDSYLTTIIKGGNIILFGTRNWTDRRTSSVPSVDLAAAGNTVRTHLAPVNVNTEWQKARLTFVPVAVNNGSPKLATPGDGVELRLVWVLQPGRTANAEPIDEMAYWEALVDAHSGNLLAFQDTRQYGTASARNVAGGIYPVSNDGVAPDGVEQAGYPMPSANVSFGAESFVTDTGGNVLSCLDGSISADLTGPYVAISDNCGAVSLSSSGDIDFGTSGGDNCTTPGVGGAGNTHSSRTGFFELNRLIESAQAQLPDNSWLQQTLTSNMNINLTCNAFWGGGSVNFYRSGGGCGNTGEIAAIFDHEWGHGLDDNDTNGFISGPGEAIADIYAALRLNISCIGRGFRLGGGCGGYGDPCTGPCNGVREIDWAEHTSNAPHTVANFINDECQGIGGSPGPCGGETHCEGMVPAEAGYDLFKRDLPAAGFDSNTSLEIANRLTYLGAGTIGTWYTCTGSGSDGCGATGGYLNYLAADDDNGNLTDGTPHIEEIFAAFDRHGIACATPTPTNNGCSGLPVATPTVVATPLDRGVHLSWGALAGTTWYNIYRTDGVHACDFGKTLVGTTTGTEYIDAGLQNGRNYSYVVLPGNGVEGGLCMGNSSSCTSVVPAPAANPVVVASSVSLSILSGDADAFLDNCESATISFDAENLGSSLTNPVITGVVSPSHPAIDSTISFTPSMGGSLASCGSASGSFTFIGDGIAPGDTIDFVVSLSGTELGGVSRTSTLSVVNGEQDLEFHATETYDFETDNDGWVVQSGTFGRTGTGGGGGTTWFQDSSDSLDDQCDRIRSPGMILEPSSTLSLYTNYDIEAFSGGTWYDRANVSVVTPDGSRLVVNPDGGRP